MAWKKPKSKQEFIERESLAWLDLTLPVIDLPEKMWTQPGAAGDWSLKDVWAHLAAWMNKTRQVMPMLIAGEKIPANIQAFNDAQYEKNRNVALNIARARLKWERKRVLAMIAKLDEDTLLKNSRVYSWASFSTFNHYAEHIPGVMRFARAEKRKLRRGK